MPQNEAENQSWQSYAIHIATWLQSGSALTFSAFLAMHLASPVAAVFGVDANTVLLLTREYYQTSLLEPALVFGSLGVHLLSGAVRRLLLVGRPKWKALSWHSVAGFALVPIVGGHVYTHRLFPFRLGLSPSLLSYQYTSYILHNNPISSWVTYGLISVIMSYHGTSGLRRILSSRTKAATLPRRSSARYGCVCLVSGLGLGLAALSREGAHVPMWLGKRYSEMLSQMYA